jgi:hypothetical protein
LHELLKRRRKKKKRGKREIGITLNWSGRRTAFLACINMVVEGTNHHKKGVEEESEAERERERERELLVCWLTSWLLLFSYFDAQSP